MLRRLKAANSNEAWLYLALLHAATSQVLADPFTGMSGTEMALHLLPPNSSSTWSCKPLSSTSTRILTELAKMTPCRQFYPSHLRSMQTVTWPAAIAESCAHEAFYPIARELINDSQRMSFAFSPSSSESSSACSKYSLPRQTDEHLSRRAYLRQAKLLTATERADAVLQPVTYVVKPAPIAHVYKAPKQAENIRFLMATSSAWHWSAGRTRIVELIYEPNEALRWKQAETAKHVNSSITNWFQRTEAHHIRQNWLEVYKYALVAHQHVDRMSKLKVIVIS